MLKSPHSFVIFLIYSSCSLFNMFWFLPPTGLLLITFAGMQRQPLAQTITSSASKSSFIVKFFSRTGILSLLQNDMV